MAVTENKNMAQQLLDKANAKAMQSSSKIKSKNAFNEVYQRYKAPIFFLTLRMVKMNKDVANDLVQEIFVKVYEKIKQYNHSVALSTWIYKIANNHIIDYKRRQNVEVLSVESLSTMTDEEGNANEQSFQLEDKGLDAFKILVAQERAEAVLEALNKGVDCELSKQVITLIFLDDKSYDDVAAQMQLPIGTVKNMMFRAKKSMKKYLSREKPELEFGRVIEKAHKWQTAKEAFTY